MVGYENNLIYLFMKSIENIETNDNSRIIKGVLMKILEMNLICIFMNFNENNRNK